MSVQVSIDDEEKFDHDNNKVKTVSFGGDAEEENNNKMRKNEVDDEVKCVSSCDAMEEENNKKMTKCDVEDGKVTSVSLTEKMEEEEGSSKKAKKTNSMITDETEEMTEQDEDYESFTVIEGKEEQLVKPISSPPCREKLEELEEQDENLESFPPIEEEQVDKSLSSSPISCRDKFKFAIAVEIFKYIYSSALLMFSVVVVMALIFSGQTQLAKGSHPAVAFVAIWVLIGFLAIMEGGQGCLVGLGPIDKALYEKSHPITIKSTMVVHKGDNMERFIIGRQFLVVLVVFVINLCGAAIPNATSVLNLSEIVSEIFVSTGVAMILMTIMLGQLTAQVVATDCMLDFINTYFMVFTTYASLAIEFSGLLHVVFLVQMFFSKVTGMPIESQEAPRTHFQNAFFWLRIGFSMVVLAFAFAVTLQALFQGQTTMWEGVPTVASVLIFFLLMAFVGLMEGMQIALFAVINLPDNELQEHKTAYATCQVAFRDSNLQAFLIGRQILVTICMFVVARIASLKVQVGQGENIFDVSDGVQEFLNTGLLGAIITTICASLAWRIVASSFPVAFLSNPIVYLILRICLVLEVSGLCAASWLLAALQKRVGKYRSDESYIGTPEERAANRLKKLEQGIPDRRKMMMSARSRPSMRDMRSYRSTSLCFSVTDPDFFSLPGEQRDEEVATEDRRPIRRASTQSMPSRRASMQSMHSRRPSMQSFHSPSLQLLFVVDREDEEEGRGMRPPSRRVSLGNHQCSIVEE